MANKVGRKADSPLVKAKRQVLKTIDAMEDLQKKITLQVSATEAEGGAERSAELVKVYKERLAVAEMMHAAQVEKKASRRGKFDLEKQDKKNSAEYKAFDAAYKKAKKKEDAQIDKMARLPYLGMTKEEWEQDGAAILSARGLGRPPVPMEVEFYRARDAFNEAFGELQIAAKAENVELPSTFDEIKAFIRAEASEIKSKAGRKSHGLLGELDSKLKHQLRKLKDAEALPDQAPEPTSTRGRTPIPKAERLRIVNDKIAELNAMIAQEESKLTGEAKKERQIKKLKDERYALRLILKTTKDAVAKQNLKKVEAKIAKLEGKSVAKITDSAPQKAKTKEDVAEEHMQKLQAETTQIEETYSETESQTQGDKVGGHQVGLKDRLARFAQKQQSAR
ncbi:hypothetical protein [Neptuniibacter sp. QD37_11]|uniref:hypothetical protein n=1 Tax=Neptuniibacter sp. QD37_11 TaxID=3398209 RepID=UPI0039F527B3